MENMSGKQTHLREAILWYCISTPCIVSKKEWNTKEEKGKPMMHAFYALLLAKWHGSGQIDVEQCKIKPVALSIVELCFAEDIHE